MQQQMQQMAPCPVVSVGTWVGEGGRTRKQSVALAFGAGAGKGEIRRRPRCCGVGENWCRGPGTMSLLPPKFAAFAASSLHQLPCWGRWGCSGTRQQGRRPGQNGSRLGPSSTETLLQFPQNPPAKRAGAIHDAVANSEEHGSMESWEASHGCRRGWHSGRLETRQSHGFKISRLNLAGPCRRLGGLGCCPALRLLGAPFPDPSSTTTHTTHAHGTRRPSILHQQATLARAWDDPVGASLLAFLSSMGTVVFGLGGATLLLFAHGDDGCVSKGAAPFCVLPMGACRGRVTGHLASTGQQLQPSSLLFADR